MYTMLTKLTTLYKQIWPHLEQLRDIRVTGMVVFGVIVLLMTWSGVKVIEKNYVLQKQISRLQQENQVRDLENQNLALQNQYYDTDTYRELQARRSFGLAKPGEAVIIVPKEVALSKLIPDETSNKVVSLTGVKDTRPFFVKNIEAWGDFLLHRQR